MRKKCETKICDNYEEKLISQVNIVGDELHVKNYATLKEIKEEFRKYFSDIVWAKIQKCIKNKVDQVPQYMGNGVVPYLNKQETDNLIYIGDFDNRALSIKRIRTLIEKISEDGYITQPELIKMTDDKMRVGDGQHKCLAYYILGYKIPKIYTFETSLNKKLNDMIIRINSNMKNWPTKDYERKYKKDGCLCTLTKEKLQRIKPELFPSFCIYMFITGKRIDKVGDFVKKTIEEKESLMRMGPEDLEGEFHIFVEKCLKRLVRIFGKGSYSMFAGFTIFAVENGLENITYTGFLNYLENLDVKFSTITGPSDKKQWKDYFTSMYNKYHLNKQ